MTESERIARLKTLIAQRDNALWRGMPSTVAALDREIAELVRDAAPPASRAVTR